MLPRHIEVAAQDYRLVQCEQELPQGGIPGSPVLQTGQAALGGWDIDIQGLEAVIFQSDQAALHVKFPNPHAIPDGKRLLAGKCQRSGVAWALGRIPELEVPWGGEGAPGLDLLAAEDVRA